MENFFASNFLKYAGILFIIAGIPLIFIDKTSGSDVLLLFGLFFVFISKEKKEDERSNSIRFSSMTIAFLISFLVSYLTRYFFEKGIIEWRLTEINHFSIMVFSLAILIFYLRLYLIEK